MIELSLRRKPDGPLRVLCIGAHCDDIEIGCGGTLLTLIEERIPLDVYWMVLCSTPPREEEARRSAGLFLRGAGQQQVRIEKFRDGFLPYLGPPVKDTFERMKAEFDPDIIFTHFLGDRHQDHRLVSDLTWNTFRDHMILEYEIPKYDGDLGSPNVFVGLSEELCRRKCGYVLDSFPSQRVKHWFTEDALMSILRLRGVEASASAKFAEGFYNRKVTLKFGPSTTAG